MRQDGDPVSLATRLFDAIERGDIEAMADCFAPDARIWHNITRQAVPKAQAVDSLASSIVAIGTWRYENRRVRAFDGGFVQQHDLRRKGPDGSDFIKPFCVVGLVRDGRITHIDEYFDRAD